MRRQARAIKGDRQHKIDHALGAGNVRVAVMAVAFVAVLREGLEAALFLIAVATGDSGWQVLLGGTLGLAIAAVLLARAVLFLRGAGDLGSVWNDVYDVRAVPSPRWSGGTRGRRSSRSWPGRRTSPW
jgi:high-affinity iron transporter